jgi:hypothetical protein
LTDDKDGTIKINFKEAILMYFELAQEDVGLDKIL